MKYEEMNLHMLLGLKVSSLQRALSSMSSTNPLAQYITTHAVPTNEKKNAQIARPFNISNIDKSISGYMHENACTNDKIIKFGHPANITSLPAIKINYKKNMQPVKPFNCMQLRMKEYVGLSDSTKDIEHQALSEALELSKTAANIGLYIIWQIDLCNLMVNRKVDLFIYYFGLLNNLSISRLFS